MPGELIMAIDQGTTNTKALLVSREGRPVFLMSVPVALLQPQSGYVEQDPIALWNSVCTVIEACLVHAREMGAEIAGIAISNQRETALAWQRKSGQPVANAISWQCRRSAALCDRLSNHAADIRRKSGLPLDPLVSAGKWAWILGTHPELAKTALEGEICFGNIDSWIVYNLTRGEVHATDHSNASRTALLNLNTLTWDEDLLNFFGIPLSAMPAILPSKGLLGHCTAFPDLAGIPIVSAIGDSHAALVGHGRYEPGVTKATYGTGSSLMTLTSGLPPETGKLARTIAWSAEPNRVQCALEGNISMTGSAVQWVGEFLGLPKPVEDAVALAETVADAGGVIFVPAMVGLGAPYWDHNARGTIANLERFHTAAHLARAAVDAIAYQVADVFFAMEASVSVHLPAILVDGGASRNDALMQMQADLLQRPVYRSDDEELSALGAAWLGGMTLGWWKSFDDLTPLSKHARTFEPKWPAKKRDRMYSGWQQAVGRARLVDEELAS
jgi:glycerol kinase